MDWNWLVADYRRIRELIADTIPGFKDFNTRIQHPGGFYLGNSAGERQWNTPSGRANFRPERPAQGPGPRTHPRHRASCRT